MSDQDYSLDFYRTNFGKYLKLLRTDRKMTQAFLQTASGVAATLISAFEHGDRGVGPEVAEKLAAGLQLNEYERERFLMGAAKTRRRDRLMTEARELPPEVLNYVPKMLPGLKIDPAKITGADYWKAGEASDRYIGNRLDREYARLRSAMIGIDQYDLLYVADDGERYLCALLAVPLR